MALTPMMQQYFQVKEKCKDCILFFRLGDFYEMFFEDAEVASRELELVLTGRDCGLSERAPMCGIPFHAANSYIGRLVSKGYKIAICEQMEDPALAKGIVKRDIIKVVTPGTYTDSSFLEESKNNYIMSLYIDNDLSNISMCFCDVSTGEFDCTYSEFSGASDITLIMDELSKFMPKELLVEETISESILAKINERFSLVITKVCKECFSENSYEVLDNQFCNFNKEHYNDMVLKCSSALLRYVIETQKVSLTHINNFNYYNILDYLSIDINSRRNLELTETLRDKSKRGSVLWVLDKTNTSMGARQLRNWVDQPLLNKEAIEKRHSALEDMLSNLGLMDDIKNALKSIYDIERIVGKISSKSVNAKELISLRNSIEKIPEIKRVLEGANSPLLQEMYSEMDELRDIYDVLLSSLLDGPAISVKEGNIIKDGYSKEVDELRCAKAHGKEWIASLENEEREVTGIKSLKVGYNKIFGYYIEITKANFGSIPDGRYIRKQTLSNAERYITPELKEMEEKILGAEEKLISLEYEIFTSIREDIEKEIDRMKKTSKIIAQLDCLVALALVALENNYCKPIMTEDDEVIIEEGRHPVVEQNISKGNFVSNDTNINTSDEQLLLITGPNMAGKSTYMRQVALIIVMAQIGSYVPAKSAKISICDKIFTRIGASDDLAGGKSTFMVEMWEVSNILKNASNKSLILLDEVGRGTSTYDGLSIAWSVIEYICENNRLRCKTLFATHYHELTKLEGMIKGVKNYSVSVKELENEIVFLRKIIRGGADQSYGIEVAKLAGLPEKVINRAKEILLNIEGDDGKKLTKSVENTLSSEAAVSKDEKCEKNIIIKEDVLEQNDVAEKAEIIDTKYENKNKKKGTKVTDNVQLDFSDIQKDALVKEIASIDILSMNPMDGFNKLYSIINKAKNL